MSEFQVLQSRKNCQTLIRVIRSDHEATSVLKRIKVHSMASRGPNCICVEGVKPIRRFVGDVCFPLCKYVGDNFASTCPLKKPSTTLPVNMASESRLKVLLAAANHKLSSPVDTTATPSWLSSPVPGHDCTEEVRWHQQYPFAICIQNAYFGLQMCVDGCLHPVGHLNSSPKIH